MIHRYLDDSGSHWATNTNGAGRVLAQLQDRDGEQVRVIMAPVQAREFAADLVRLASQAEAEGRAGFFFTSSEELQTALREESNRWGAWSQLGASLHAMRQFGHWPPEDVHHV